MSHSSARVILVEPPRVRPFSYDLANKNSEKALLQIVDLMIYNKNSRSLAIQEASF